MTPGTEVRLSTTLGTLPDIVTTDSRGMAQATLQAGDRAGVARVTASSGTVQSAELEVLIGFRPGTLILEAEPREIGLRGGTTRLTARVLDEEGASLSGVPVTFASPAGSFTTNPVSTDEQGRAATDLVLSEDDVAFLGGDELEVAAEATAAGATATGVVRIRVQRRLEASFTMTTDGLKVIFRDTSTGQPRDWYWSFGDGRSRSTQHPTHEYHGPGTYTVTLYVWNAEQEDRVSQFVTVSR